MPRLRTQLRQSSVDRRWQLVAVALAGAVIVATIALLSTQSGGRHLSARAAGLLESPSGHGQQTGTSGSLGTSGEPSLFVDRGSVGGRCSNRYRPSQVSATTPWCTLAHAIVSAPAGSTVYVRGHTYPFQKLSRGRRRALSAYVTFEPYGFDTKDADQVTIDGLRLSHAAYVRFVGFHFVGTDASTDVPGFFLGPGSDNVQLIDNEFTGQGIEVDGASDVQIQGNYVHDTTTNCAIHTQRDGAGIYVTGGTHSSVDNIQIIGNRIEHTGQDGIDAGHVRNAVIRGNDVSVGVNPAGGPACGYHVDELQDENGGMGPITIADNVFHDGTEFVIRNVTGLTIEDNLIVRITGRMDLKADPAASVINNTWWGGNQLNAGNSSLALIGYTPGSGWTRPPYNYRNTDAGTIIENNIMRVLQVEQDAGSYTDSYNILTGVQRRNGALGDPGSGNIDGAPRFVNAAGGDFHLASGSIGIGAGNPQVAPATDMLGKPRVTPNPDIGALQ